MSIKTLGINVSDEKQLRRHDNKIDHYAAKIAECRLVGKFENKDYAKALGKGAGTVSNFISTYREPLEARIDKYLELYVKGSSKLLNCATVQKLKQVFELSTCDASDSKEFARVQGQIGNIKRIRYFKDQVAEIELGKTAVEIASEIFTKENKTESTQTQGMQIIVNSSILDAN